MHNSISINQVTDRHINLRGITSKRSTLFYFVTHVLPQVKRLLKSWQVKAESCQNVELRQQALNSIEKKAFHCQGGAVFCVPFLKNEEKLLRLIIAYQTACDYLDNLCDRGQVTDGQAFHQLHLSLIDALTPNEQYNDYYAYYPHKNDTGYLNALVTECRTCLTAFSSYAQVYPYAIKLANWYIDLQIKKHIEPQNREREVKTWAEKQMISFPGIYWQEFAAASGSTLALFALFGLATLPDINKEYCQKIFATYFPWICGLHILLDYFIDQDEDRAGGDFNFTFYYRDYKEMTNRLRLFVRKAHQCADGLSGSPFHHTVVEGLLAMYLSDKKVKEQGFEPIARILIDESGPGTWKTFRLCQTVRLIY